MGRTNTMQSMYETHLSHVCEDAGVDDETRKRIMESNKARFGEFSGTRSKKSKSSTGEKRPATSYILFTQDARERAKKLLGSDAKPTEVTTKLGEMWKALSDKEKEPYIQKSQQLRDEYNARNGVVSKSATTTKSTTSRSSKSPSTKSPSTKSSSTSSKPSSKKSTTTSVRSTKTSSTSSTRGRRAQVVEESDDDDYEEEV